MLLPRVPKGKKGIHIYLDDDLYQELLTLIGKKFTKLHGALSRECEYAIAFWVSRHKESLGLNTNMHKLVNPTLPRNHTQAQEIIFQLKNQGLTSQCTIRDLSKVIENVRGSDPRTITKWTKFLVNHGYLKWTAQNRVLEILDVGRNPL